MCGSSKFGSMAFDLKEELKGYGKLVLWLIPVGYGTTLLSYNPWERDPVRFVKIGFISTVLWALMWIGNDFSAHWLTGKVSWTQEPVKRLIYGMLAMIGVTLTAVYVAAALYYILLDVDVTPDIGQFLTYAFGFS